MTATLLDRLAERLRTHPAALTAATPIAVGLSGGVDSVALLAAIHRIGVYRQLRCIHIDHQLHRDSALWSDFCRDFAGRLGIDFECHVVECEVAGRSVEAAARAARYAAFAAQLRESEVLLTAHHADDQLETVLYRLVRGTGMDGLRGIREFESFGRGFLMRPFLTETRAAIVELAQTLGLEWLEDPSNADVRFDRNYLRQAVVPGVLARWPLAGRAAARFSAAANDSAELAAALAAADLEGIDALDRLPLPRLTALGPARQRNVLRYAVRQLGLPAPDAAGLERIRALADSAAGQTDAEWPGAEAHRHGTAVYLRRARTPVPGAALPLLLEQPCSLAEGWLSLARVPAPALPEEWVRDGLSVRFRAGGERFQPAGSTRAQPLREWMRASDLLPWMRDRVPLIYHGGDLVAVADLSISAAAVAAAGSAHGWRVIWHDRPRTN
jgi:tRNA(Ile)-lysidine synthase